MTTKSSVSGDALGPEQVLRMACETAGTLLSGEQVLVFWQTLVPSGQIPRDAHNGKWNRLFKPLLSKGKVVKVMQWRTAYYGPGGLGLQPPPRAEEPRRPLTRTLERAADAVASLEIALDRWGCWVQGWEIMRCWEEGGGEPRAFPGGVPRALQPALDDGRVQDRVVRGVRFYCTRERTDLPLPEQASDEERAIEAVRLACETHSSAVPMELIETALVANPSLTLRGKTPLAAIVSTCARRGRLVKRVPQGRSDGGRWYYSLPGQHVSITRDATKNMDARFLAFERAWEWSGGIPLSIPMLRRFCELRGISFPNDPPYAWTNALHHLELRGEVVSRALEVGQRDLVWALATDWQTMGEERQGELLRAAAGDRSGVEGEHPLGVTSSIDFGWVSRNHDCRRLVEATCQELASRQRSARAARLAKVRPVSLEELREYLEGRGGRLGAVTTDNLATAMQESVRVRAEYGMRKSRVRHVGVVAGRSYYSVHDGREGEAYTEYLSLVGEDVRGLERELAAVEEALRLHREGLIPVSERILDARGALLHGKGQAVLERARDLPSGHFTEEEWHALDLLRKGIASVLQGIPESMLRSGRCEPVPAPPRIDVAVAANEVAQIGGPELAQRRMLPSRLPSVGLIHLDPSEWERSDDAANVGRSVETEFDLVSYRLYAMKRWAGPALSSLARQAAWTLGELRNATPMIATIKWDAAELHETAAAALAVIGDGLAREALRDYLSAVVTRECRENASMPALEMAAWGLSRPPFGGSSVALLPQEEEVLRALQGSRVVDDRLQWVAARILRSWREDWTLAERLYL